MNFLFILKWTGLGLALFYLGLALFAMVAGQRLALPSPESSYTDSPDILKIPYGKEERKLSALYLTHPEATRLILYSGGNMEDLGRSLPRLQTLRDQGYNVLAWDYPGYGTSQGKATEKAVLQGALAVLQYAREELRFPFERIVIYGRSVGGGPSIWLATQAPVSGIVLEGTFTSIFRIATKIRILPWDIFPNLERIREVSSPVLFLHGTEDEVVPFSHGKKLLEATTARKVFLWFDGGMHNNLVEDYPEIYYPAVTEFIESL